MDVENLNEKSLHTSQMNLLRVAHSAVSRCAAVASTLTVTHFACVEFTGCP
jgi:hypothetical protein